MIDGLRTVRCGLCAGTGHGDLDGVGCRVCLGRGWHWSDGRAPTLCPGGGRAPLVEPDLVTDLPCGRHGETCPGCDRPRDAIGVDADRQRTIDAARRAPSSPAR